MLILPSSSRRLCLLAGIAACAIAASLNADPLSKHLDIDFFRDISSRDLHGLATRSDGRIVAGPALTELTGDAPAGLLWALTPGGAGRWLIGTGPEGRIFEVNPDLTKHTYTSREVVRLDDSQVFSLKRLPNGAILAGTSPHGGLYLIVEGKIVARVNLPADSIFDIVLRESKEAAATPAPAVKPGAAPTLSWGRTEALVATGNPGKIFKINLAAFASSGITTTKVISATDLSTRGITTFGEIRDRNVRRMAVMNDGRLAVGSSPKGNIYMFPAAGGAPLLLQENKDAEVTDLLPQSNGDLISAITFSTNASEVRTAATPEKPKEGTDLPPPAQVEKFSGRGVLVRFPANGFPEALCARIGGAYYHLAQHGSVVLIAGGEQGDMTGYDLTSQFALTFPGSGSARLNDLAPVPGSQDQFLVLRNNTAGLDLLDFKGASARTAETRVLDLASPSQLGALRLDRLRDVDAAALTVKLKTGNGSDDLEGWSPWTLLTAQGDGWRANGLSGRYFKLQVGLPATAAGTAQVDKATLYCLPQNHRPQMQEFHFLSPNYAIVPAPEPAQPIVTTIGQLLQVGTDDKHKNNFLASQVAPSPGTQVAFWTVNDPDGDNILYTFSIRKDGDPNWTDITVDSHDAFSQFDTAHLPDGIYFTHLMAKETAPRPVADRLFATFETDNLVVDHTPPDILDATIKRSAQAISISVHGRDALSLLYAIEVTFNNGAHEVVEQPADGVRDGREETFVLEEPLAQTAGATAVDVTLYDTAGNATTRRLAMPH